MPYTPTPPIPGAVDTTWTSVTEDVFKTFIEHYPPALVLDSQAIPGGNRMLQIRNYNENRPITVARHIVHDVNDPKDAREDEYLILTEAYR